MRVFAAIRHWMQSLRATFFFVPALMVVAAIGLATVMIAVDTVDPLHVVARWPRLFGAGAAGARGLLTAIASSMITLAGVVFSITIVALSLTSSQYTSRVLRNFMRDRINQAVLGVFVGVFAYCLVVLRTIRAGDEGAFVPSLSVLVGLLLAFVGIAFLIGFIHHIAMSIQASSIIATAAEDTIEAIDHLFPAGVDDPLEADADLPRPHRHATEHSVLAPESGYIQRVDDHLLLAWARNRSTVVEMDAGIGEFVVAGMPLMTVALVVDDHVQAELETVYVISKHRLVDEDAAFGIRQIVDIALKALSPGINDSTTAVMCVDYLTAVLRRLVTRTIPSPLRTDGDGTLRIRARGPTFATLVAEIFDQIRQNAGANVAVIERMLFAIESVSSIAPPGRRAVLRRHASLVHEDASRALNGRQELAQIDAAFARAVAALEVDYNPR